MAQKKGHQDSETEFVSLANKYDLDFLDMIKDRNGLLNGELAVQHAFTVLDKCLPELGQFTQVMQSIREQLFSAVYSEKITECGGKVARLPYFKIIEATEDEAAKKLDTMNQNNEAITKRLFEKQLEYEALEAELLAAERDVKKLKKELTAQKDTNEDLVHKIESLEAKLVQQEEKSDETIRGLRLKIAEMKHDLEDKQAMIVELEKYRKGYNDLDKVFLNWPTKIMDRVSAEKSMIAEGKNKLAEFRTSTGNGRFEAAATVSTALTRQLEELEKQLIDDYEKETGEVKTALVNRRLILDNLDPGIEVEQEEMNLQAKRSVRMERGFNGFMTIAARELDMLREHEQNMASLQAARAQKEKARLAEQEIDPNDQSKDVIPSEPVTEAAENPFIPNELILSKFSIIIQVSQDGLHFYDLPVNEPCGMCGLSSVLVCPHHILSRQITIPLTPNTLYLRIIRPTLKITTSEIVGPAPDLSKPVFESDLVKAGGAGDIRDTVSSTGVQMAYGRPKPRDLSEEKSIERFVAAVGKRSTSVLRGTQYRELSEEKMYTLCEDIIAHLLSSEYASPHKAFSLFDNLFNFVENHYRSVNAAHLVVGDLAYNLPFWIEKGDRFLQLFGMMLNGVIDSAMLKYISLLADAVLTIDWRHPVDYWAFACVVYPFLDQEDADIVQMNFTSFTEGKMSSAIVLEYLLFCVLRGTELRYQQMFEQLHEMASGQPSFTEDEFIKAVRDLLPKQAFNHARAKSLFLEAYESTYQWNASRQGKRRNDNPTKGPLPPGEDFYQDAISTERAAQICCYLDLLAIIDSIKDTLWTHVLEARTSSAIVQIPEKAIAKQIRPIVRFADANKFAIQNAKFKKFKLRANLDQQEKDEKDKEETKQRKK